MAERVGPYLPLGYVSVGDCEQSYAISHRDDPPRLDDVAVQVLTLPYISLLDTGSEVKLSGAEFNIPVDLQRIELKNVGRAHAE